MSERFPSQQNTKAVAALKYFLTCVKKFLGHNQFSYKSLTGNFNCLIRKSDQHFSLNSKWLHFAA